MKNIIIILGVIGLIIIGFFVTKSNTPVTGNTFVSDRYRAYDETLLSRANDGDVVLFFRASWCPTCRALDTDIKANEIPVSLTILDIDYDNSSELRKKYGVTTQHTLVKVDSKGELIKKWSGGNTLKTIIDRISE